MNRWQKGLFLLAIWFLAWTAPAQAEGSEGLEAQALTLYRQGDYRAAAQAWQDLLQADGPPGAASARAGELCYNIGNALYRDGQSMQAIAWYQAGLRHLPRSSDLRANLSFARGEMGLPPAEGDGLADTAGSWLARWTPAEARWLALFGLGLLALALVLEALFGGALWRRCVWIAAGLGVLSLGPWLRHVLVPDVPAAIVVAERGATGRSEPRADARSLEQLDPTERVISEDVWQDWVKVRTRAGKSVWVLANKVQTVWR